MPRRTARQSIAEALSWAQLDLAAERPLRSFSGGMKRRLELARALMHRPRLIVLDEPTLGLDPQGRRDLWDRIARLRAGGMSVLMTTHATHEAEACTRVGIIDRGRLVALGTPADLSRRAFGGPGMPLEEVFVQIAGRALRDTEASPRDRIVAFHKRGGEHTR